MTIPRWMATGVAWRWSMLLLAVLDRGGRTRPQARRCPPLWLVGGLLGLCWATDLVGAPLDPLPFVGHQITARIDPDAGTIAMVDQLTLPQELGDQVEFVLSRNLRPRLNTHGARLQRIDRHGHLRRYRLTLGAERTLELRATGRIRQPLAMLQEGIGRERGLSFGTIESDGVYLSGASGWYPHLSGTLEHFALSVDLPAGWLAVSQGSGPEVRDLPDGGRRVRWREDQPQDEIYLIAGRFHLDQRPTPRALAQTFLRTPDAVLAARYLEATETYLDRYSRLIGPYPYAKFALVENFWETGYGMPSFTLLGPRVLRLPFILHSSYPHEILHNWWGNGVFVAMQDGNWSEGLTAYLADHLNRELAGEGAEYRREQLKAYADFVHAEQDFSLRAFRARHGGADQAIGYGKALMVFHMLRLSLGDEAFLAGLRQFYRDWRFRHAGFAQLRQVFEAASGRDLTAYFAHWVERPGAPQLALSGVVREVLDQDHYRVSGWIEQTQPEPPFPLPVMLAIATDDGQVRWHRIESNRRRQPFAIMLPKRPARVALDPGFDSFRVLFPAEAPVSLGSLFGAERGLLVLPSKAPEAVRAAYQGLAERWQQGQDGWSLVEDSALATLPEDRAVWLFGWENLWLERFAAPSDGQFQLDRDRRALQIAERSDQDMLPVLTWEANGQPFGWLALPTDDPAPSALLGLASRIPRYGNEGFLVFAGDGGALLARGRWPLGVGPFDVRFDADGAKGRIALPSRPPLTRLKMPAEANQSEASVEQ